MTDKARQAAFYGVKRILSGAYSNLINFGEDLKDIDRSFAENIVMGTLERKKTLEFAISLFAKNNAKRDEKALLMMGVYQILYMDRVPDNAACNETVNIAKATFGKRTAGFINAVLRNICREKEEVLRKIDEADGYIKYSADSDLYDLISKQYPHCADKIFSALIGEIPLFMRVNTTKTDIDSLINKYGGEMISDTCIKCKSIGKAMSGIDSGEMYVQGLASQKAVKLLGAEPNMTVVDVCACPGGKTLGAAIDMENKGRIYAFDIHGNKLPLIEKSADRLGIDIIQTAVQDGRETKQELIGIADRVICDVPCSGTGVMGSKPEIKYKNPAEFEGLYPIQRAIIQSASKYLKVGGMMVYSTCSINRHENEEIVEEFLNNNPNFTLIYQKTTLPFEEEKEGFYTAKILREK